MAAEIFGNKILITGYELSALYSYSIRRNTHSPIFDLLYMKYKILFSHQERAFIFCDGFGANMTWENETNYFTAVI
ncbi:unnamed protein product [Blepharisma stoltei]|uniref:Uncharacterized protein n=1 Tax=Blepharisma stoltei TaxID=1481888 RepID=A0AAU9K439_9CILI|nr:unnamed protein product [Blepharisma stoltei]